MIRADVKEKRCARRRLQVLGAWWVHVSGLWRRPKLLAKGTWDEHRGLHARFNI